MPNTPVLVDEGMSVISAGSHATGDDLAHAEEIFGGVGKTLRVPESQQDAATALSGSGPAYFYFLVEAMTDAGILLGLPLRPGPRPHRAGRHRRRRDAPRQRRAPCETAGGGDLPAGTTISAIRELENHGVRAALIAALEAARDRSRELALRQRLTLTRCRPRPPPASADCRGPRGRPSPAEAARLREGRRKALPSAGINRPALQPLQHVPRRHHPGEPTAVQRHRGCPGQLLRRLRPPEGLPGRRCAWRRAGTAPRTSRFPPIRAVVSLHMFVWIPTTTSCATPALNQASRSGSP